MDELFPFAELPPPAPIVTVAVPLAFTSKFLKPPAPPPPADLVLKSVVTSLPPPPPATTRVLIIPVPDCSVIFPEEVLDVILFFPKDVALTGPIIPPFCAII
jgi:hypothetical protein|tara:strand:- start:2 stop:307 length:306 start_codon:yes stop_codon:yes gene_type:complete